MVPAMNPMDPDDRLRFESLVTELAAEFVNLPSDQVDGAIESAQRRIVEALDLDRAALYEFVDADGSLLFTHFWSRPEFPEPPRGQVTTADFPWLHALLLRGETVVDPTLDDVPSALDRESARRFGVKSNLSIPLVVGGQVVGALGFTMMRHERDWAPELVDRLQVVARVFASALDRKRADEKLRQALSEVERLRDRLRDENAYLREEVSTLSGSSLVVGRSAAIRAALEQVQQVAPTPATVLLTGETGTGKELFATQIHALSPRRERVMVRVNCAAIPAALLENELFGREQGAYTGAIGRQAGRFELAHKSTLFLDEIGDLSVDLQVKLLRVIQEREIERLGSSKSISVDVRIIAATNRDLEKAMAQGTFREDLYYRLNVFPIRVPPLRDRTEDLAPLVWSFVEEFSKTFGKEINSIPKDSMLALQQYAWPGNVRELRNIIERAVIVATGPRLVISVPRPSPSSPVPHQSVALTDLEREHIVTILERVKWRVRGTGGAAELLKMKPSTLEGRMTKLGIHRRDR